MPLWPLSTTREALDEEAASLTRNASPWTREPELPTRGDDDGANGIRRFNDDKDSTGGLAAATSTRWKRDAADTRRSVMVRYAIASFLLVAVFGAYARHAGYFSSYRAVTAFDSDDEGISDRGTPWAKFGLETSVALSVKPARLPPCERTMLVDWQSFQFGFGSTATTILQAGIVAKMQGYTMLFGRDANKYGRYLDFFEPAALECHAPEELYDLEYYRKGREIGFANNVGSVINDHFERPAVNRLLVGFDDIHQLNHHITALVYPNMTVLDSLPTLDASKPVPISSNVPRVFAETFDQYSASSAEHFRLNAVMESTLNSELTRLGLDDGKIEAPSQESESSKPRTIGIHWRGGDKLARECVASSQLSCGNVTHHCVTAWDAISGSSRDRPSFGDDTGQDGKPRLLIMTTESNALELFRQDDFCRQHFGTIESLERAKTDGLDAERGEGSSSGLESFVQDQWNAQTDAQRLRDARSMFVGAEILSNHVDRTVLSPNSNLARIIMTRAGPRRVKRRGIIRSVDIYWHPVQFPPFKRSDTWGGCDGTWGGCWPHD